MELGQIGLFLLLEDFLALVDICDAYLLSPIFSPHQRYLCFAIPVDFHQGASPGLSCAPGNTLWISFLYHCQLMSCRQSRLCPVNCSTNRCVLKEVIPAVRTQQGGFLHPLQMCGCGNLFILISQQIKKKKGICNGQL